MADVCDPADDSLDKIISSAEALVDAVTFDDSGFEGKGGNGGLLSRETIRKADELRIEISRARRRLDTVREGS